MSPRVIVFALLLAVVGYWLWEQDQAARPPVPKPAPVAPKPEPPKPPPNKPKPGPWGPRPCPKEGQEAAGSVATPGFPVIGGRVAPDGVTQIQCDLPVACRKKNIASQGLGCCVFRSGDYAGHWQHETPLYDLPEKMVSAGIAGGGWPEKVDQVFKKLCPGVKYAQDTTGDSGLLKAILASGRVACVTYNGHDPHYGNRYVAHMVCLVHYDGKWACVSDNNYPGDDEFVWMSCPEFDRRWSGQGRGWVYFLLAPPPPPIPTGV